MFYGMYTTVEYNIYVLVQELVLMKEQNVRTNSDGLDCVREMMRMMTMTMMNIHKVQ